MAIRLATPPPAATHTIPSSMVTNSSAACGLQKQLFPGHAWSVLYWPMTNSPPIWEMTFQSALRSIHLNPNHNPSVTAAPATKVSALLYHELNRLAYAQPTTPTSERGGGTGAGIVRGSAAMV